VVRGRRSAAAFMEPPSGAARSVPLPHLSKSAIGAAVVIQKDDARWHSC
jgi:hypothetical protein